MVTLPAGVSNGHIEKNCAEENWYYQPCHCLQKLELHKRTKATTITDTPWWFSKTRWTFAVLKCVFELKQARPRWVIVRSDSAAAAAPFTTQSLLAMFAPSKCFLRPKVFLNDIWRNASFKSRGKEIEYLFDAAAWELLSRYEWQHVIELSHRINFEIAISCFGEGKYLELQTGKILEIAGNNR